MLLNENWEIKSLLQNLQSYLQAFESEELSYAEGNLSQWQKEFYKWLGHFEGQRLKSLGLISSEFSQGLEEYFELFGARLELEAPLKMPFEGKALKLAFLDAKYKMALKEFLEGLLSVYGGKKLSLEIREESGENFSFQILKFSEGEASSHKSLLDREFRHEINNHLSGILSLSSLLKNKQPHLEEIRLIEESAQKLKAAFNPKTP